MAHRFTTLCQDSLKEKLELDSPNFQWCTEKRFESRGKVWEWVEVDIYGENPASVLCIEFEMYRRGPGNNAMKLHELLKGHRHVYPFAEREILILHVFSPFYEVGPYFKRSSFCEEVMPQNFKAIGVTYTTFRWNLDEFREVRGACQSTSNADNFSDYGQLDRALDMLAIDLGKIIRNWESGLSNSQSRVPV